MKVPHHLQTSQWMTAESEASALQHPFIKNKSYTFYNTDKNNSRIPGNSKAGPRNVAMRLHSYLATWWQLHD